MSVADPNQLILTGENPFIRLSATDGAPNTTNASFWRIILCPAGPGHVLYLKSELTDDRWRIYSDNIAMARWLQSTVQGMLNAEMADTTIPVIDAEFTKSGDARYFWTERLVTTDEEIALTWYNIGEPLLIHTQPNAEPGRPYGVCTVLIPALGARLTRNGIQAVGPTVATGARGTAVQHLRAGILRKLDGGAVMQLEGKIGIITGAASGIGAACARVMSREGAKAAADRSGRCGWPARGRGDRQRLSAPRRDRRSRLAERRIDGRESASADCMCWSPMPASASWGRRSTCRWPTGGDRWR